MLLRVLHRFRHCRPTTFQDLSIPEGTRGSWAMRVISIFLGTRWHSLATACDSFAKKTWGAHVKACLKNEDRVIGYACLDQHLIGALEDTCEWATMPRVGHSWFRDDQLAAPSNIPYMEAMKSRPPESYYTGKRPFFKAVTSTHALPF